MKDAKFLIETHFYKNPLFFKLNNAKQCRDLVLLLIKTHRDLIYFCYVKNETLFFVVKHPLALLELQRDNNITMIKALLKKIISADENSVFKDVKEIKFFVAKELKFKHTKDPYQQILYTPKIPRSKAEFKNNAKTAEIYNKFEELREILKAKIAKRRA